MSNARDHERAKSAAATAGTPAKPRDNAGAPRVVHSATLLDGRSQLAILHNETIYFLRETRFGKLILTK